LLGSKLSVGRLRARHLAGDDHALGEADGGACVTILSDDMLDMGETLAGGVLDAPCPALRAPLDLGPHHAVNLKPMGLGVNPANLDYAKSSLVGAHL
jgi:hypothetical protein